MEDYSRSLRISKAPAPPEQAMRAVSGLVLATVPSLSVSRARRMFTVGDAGENVIVSVNRLPADSDAERGI